MKLIGAVALVLLPFIGAHASGPVNIEGVWQIHAPVTELKTIHGAAPPLLPQAQRLYQERQALLRSGDRSFDDTRRCKPMGEPRTAYDPDGGPFEIIVNPKVIVFGYTWNRMVRFAYVSDAPIDAIGPSYYGTARARWDRGVLIIEAQALHDSTLLDAAGMPHSEQLRLTERYRELPDRKHLEERLHVDDPATFSEPWDARLVYDRLPKTQITEDVCIERLGIKDY